MKTFIKILATLFVFIGSQIMVIGGLIFPTTLVMIMSFTGLVFYPFNRVIEMATGEIDENSIANESFIDKFKSPPLNHFLGTTVILWFGVWSAYEFYKNGDLNHIN